MIKSHNELVIAKVKNSDYRKTYSGLLWWAERQGYKRGWAKFKFGEIFGKWPAPVTPVVPEEPSQDLREYLGIMKNRWKAKKKREELKQSSASRSASSAGGSRDAGAHGT